MKQVKGSVRVFVNAFGGVGFDIFLLWEINTMYLYTRDELIEEYIPRTNTLYEEG